MVYDAQRPMDFSGLQAALMNVANMRQRNKELQTAQEQRNAEIERAQKLAQDKAAAEQAEARQRREALQAYMQGNPAPLAQNYPDLFVKMEGNTRSTVKAQAEQQAATRDRAQKKAQNTARFKAAIQDQLARGADPIALQQQVDKFAAGGSIERFDITGGNLEGPAAPLAGGVEADLQGLAAGLEPEKVDSLTRHVANSMGLPVDDPRVSRRVLRIKEKQGSTTVNVETGGGSRRQELTSSQQSQVQAALIASEDEIEDLNTIEDLIEKAGGFEAFAAYQTGGINAAKNALSKLGFQPGSAREQAALDAFNDADAELAAYRDSRLATISGAAISEKEKERLFEGVPNRQSDSASQLRSKIFGRRRAGERRRRRSQRALGSGLEIGVDPKSEQVPRKFLKIKTPAEAAKAFKPGSTEFLQWEAFFKAGRL